MGGSNENRKYELSPKTIVIGIILIIISVIWWYFSDVKSPSEIYENLALFAFDSKRVPYIIIPLLGIGILHAIAVSKKKNGEMGLEKGGHFNFVSWFLSFSAVGGVGYLYDSSFRIFVGTFGELIHECDFFVEKNNYDLISLLIISALLVVVSGIILSKMIEEFIPSSWKNWSNKKNNHTH